MPNSARHLALALALGAGLAQAADDSFHAPDSLVLKDGRMVRGLIIRNSRDAVLLQRAVQETSYPKSQIIRINDYPDTDGMYTRINRMGDLPSWRVIANDLRTHDAIKSLVEIPATMIDNGVFKNVPYKSFRVNDDIELNIYGDPENPAGIELGIYGNRSGNLRLRKTLRGYLAGFLTTRQEIGALYSLGLEKGLVDVGNLTIEITPRNAPDAYGAWWVSLFNRKSLDRVRLSNAEYAKMVRPVEEVVDRKGRVIGGWTPKQAGMSKKMDGKHSGTMVLLRGFYRDKEGNFRLITEDQSVKTGENR